MAVISQHFPCVLRNWGVQLPISNGYRNTEIAINLSQRIDFHGGSLPMNRANHVYKGLDGSSRP